MRHRIVDEQRLGAGEHGVWLDATVVGVIVDDEHPVGLGERLVETDRLTAVGADHLVGDHWIVASTVIPASANTGIIEATAVPRMSSVGGHPL